MTDAKYEFISPELQAKIELSSTLPDTGESQLYTQLITHLIEEAPTSFWQKSQKELQPYEFHGQILAALLRSYSVDFDHDHQYPAHEMLQFLVDEVKAEFLQQMLPPPYDEDEDE